MQSKPRPARSQKSSNVSTFGTFLETLSLRQESSARSPEASRPTLDTKVLLTRLAEHGPEPVSSLMEEFDVGVLEMGKVLQTMQEARLVDIRRSSAGEEVVLTPVGEKILLIS